MLDNLLSQLKLDGSSAVRKFGRLDVRERVIDTGERTIAVDQIGTLTLFVHRRWLMRIVIWFAGLLLAGMLNGLATASGATGLGMLLFVTVAALAAAGAYFIKSIHRLIIGTADGSISIFETKDQRLLAEAKAFLTDKINKHDLGSSRLFIIDQSHNETNIGKIVNGEDRSVNVQGDGNQVAAHAPNARVASHDIDARVDNSMRVDNSVRHDNSMHVDNSPGAQVGYGHTAQGNTATLTRVDFSQLIGDVAILRDYFAEDPAMAERARKLAEIEALMRQGAPSPPQRSRLRELAVDMSTIMAATPQWAQFFQHIARLCGM